MTEKELDKILASVLGKTTEKNFEAEEGGASRRKGKKASAPKTEKKKNGSQI